MKPASSLLRALAMLALVMSLLPVSVAHATTAWDECTPNTGTTGYSGTINIGRDSANNNPIGPWLTLPTTTWICTRKASPAHFSPNEDQYAIRASTGPAAGINRCFNSDCSVNLGGKNYAFYRYSNKIGFIAEMQYHMQGESPSEFFALRADTHKYDTHEFFGGGPRQTGQTFWFKTTLRIRLVRMGSTDTFPSSVNFSAIRIQLQPHEHSSHSKKWTPHSHHMVKHSYALSVSFPQFQATCTTPNVNVDLGEVSTSALTSPGNTGPTREFSMRIENCPPYMALISYRFRPVPGHLAITHGTLSLDPSLSTATGVGVQVLNPDDTPLVFFNGSNATTLTEYDPLLLPHSTYTVPLKARIIRTSGALNAGTVHASMVMEMRYK